MTAVRAAMSDADVLLAVVDASELVPESLAPDPRAPDEEQAADDDLLRQVLRSSHLPLVVALNKMDTLGSPAAAAVEGSWRSLLPDAAVVPCSALTVGGEVLNSFSSHNHVLSLTLI